MYFHYKVPNRNELEVFEMEDDFLISFNDFANDIGQRPYLGKSIGFISYKLPEWSKRVLYDIDINNVSSAVNRHTNNGIISRLKNQFLKSFTNER